MIIRGQPKGGPPPERQLCLSNITAPRVARRATPNAPETKDEVFAVFSLSYFFNYYGVNFELDCRESKNLPDLVHLASSSSTHMPRILLG